MEHYPGTNNPASFESDVTLKDDIRGIQKDVTISMNKPLIYRGYRIYQSGYSQAEGQSDTSVFAIGRDPGVPVKYLGAIVMVTGMIIMFSMRRFSTNAGNLTRKIQITNHKQITNSNIRNPKWLFGPLDFGIVYCL